MRDTFTVVHTIHPGMQEVFFFGLVERIARGQKAGVGAGIDPTFCLLLEPLQLGVGERGEKARLGSVERR